MDSVLNSPARANTISKISTDTLECRRKILSYMNRGPASLMRLKEQLPLLFDSHRMWTREGQAQLLRSCSLQPVFQKTPFHHVTFALEPASETSRPL
jgi:hypothetical protein